METPAKILLVEDSPSLVRTYVAQLEKGGHVVETAVTISEAQQKRATSRPDCVLMDLQLPDGNGLDLLQSWNGLEIDLPVVVITANGSMSSAIDAMRAGACDFLVKPFGAERLLTTVANAVDKARLARTVERLVTTAPKAGVGEMIGSSKAMQAVYQTLEMSAASDASVFIQGESGTGKELAARALHKVSNRAKGPFVALNCGAMARDLLESELFGHIKGAFTGATSDRAGAAATADGGTLFLDEICEMDIELQTKLLRFIQLGEYRRVGEDKARVANIRFVCATNQHPEQAVRDGRFREDLFYRLHVLPVHMPPLRERSGDLIELADALLAKAIEKEGSSVEGFAPDASAAIASHAWPGNVRELENTIRRLVVLCPGKEITADMVHAAIGQSTVVAPAGAPIETPPAFAGGSPVNTPVFPDMEDTRPLWEIERDAIEGTISRCDGNIQLAARKLEISPSTIYRKREGWDRKASA
ncbi:MAG: sigma-54 dependent transcriptional regulator [Alphaproteobacteria bacterium]|nr:sigma-54 dependent transcriptional regulator [Alphaproteobacteria bacterium]